jgi:hypothetical protein
MLTTRCAITDHSTVIPFSKPFLVDYYYFYYHYHYYVYSSYTNIEEKIFLIKENINIERKPILKWKNTLLVSILNSFLEWELYSNS